MSESNQSERPRFFRAFESMETVVVIVLMVLMGVVILATTVDLAWILFSDLASPPVFRLKVDDLLEVLGAFLMILIGLELLETVKSYITEHHLQVETVLLVALIAVGRKIIILDLEKYQATSLLSVAAILGALSVAFYLVRRSPTEKGTGS